MSRIPQGLFQLCNVKSICEAQHELKEKKLISDMKKVVCYKSTRKKQTRGCIKLLQTDNKNKENCKIKAVNVLELHGQLCNKILEKLFFTVCTCTCIAEKRTAFRSPFRRVSIRPWTPDKIYRFVREASAKIKFYLQYVFTLVDKTKYPGALAEAWCVPTFLTWSK